MQDVPFKFDEKCIEAFQFMNKALISAPIIIAPDWDLPFEFICDASDYLLELFWANAEARFFMPSTMPVEF